MENQINFFKKQLKHTKIEELEVDLRLQMEESLRLRTMLD